MGSGSDFDSRPRGTRSWRKAAGIAGASLGLSIATLLATAPQASAVVQCPPGTILLFNACLTIGIGTPPTTTPVTTPPTTSPPLTLPPVTLPPVTLPPLPASAVSMPDAAQRLLDLANDERQRAGVGQLSMRSDIVQYALDHSNEMAAKGDIFHSTLFFTSSVKSLLNAAFRGENVAYNGSVEDAHTRLMNSPGHRANILDGRFNAAGFAVVRAPDGRYFITEDFIQAAGAPRAVAPKVAAAPAPVARKAAAPKPAPAPPTTAAPTTTTTAPPPPPTTAAPVPEAPVTTAPATIERSSSAVSGTPVKHSGELQAPLGGAAAVLLAGLIGACCVVPRRKLLT